MRGVRTRPGAVLRGWIAVACLPLASVAACGPAGGGTSGPVGCGTCEQETTAVRAEVAKIEGVTDLIDIHYAPRRNLTRPPAVVISASIENGSLDRVRPAMVEAVWTSKIAPLTYVTLDLETTGGEATNPNFQFSEGTKEYAAYRDAWGPRPVK